MKKYSLEALWTLLEIYIDSKSAHEDIIRECFLRVEKFEQKYSRFISGNFLSELNHTKKAVLDEELKYLLKISLEVHEISKWVFDITLLPLLENDGYWISESILPENIWTRYIEITDSQLILHNNISIEFWGLWKWYMLDRVFDILAPHFDRFLLNFGWDIRCKWSFEIGLEDPLDPEKSLGKYTLNSWALCSSSGNKRQLKTGHHIKNSIDEHNWVFVSHPLWIYADAFATTLFAASQHAWRDILENISDLEALIITHTWIVISSEEFKKYLTYY